MEYNKKFTPEQKAEYIADLKNTHGSPIFELEAIPDFEDENSKVTIYLRKLDRVVYSAVKKLMAKDAIQAMEAFVRSLYIGGEKVDTALTFDGLRSMDDGIYEMMESKKGTIKKN